MASSEGELTLADRWEQLAKEHKPLFENQHETSPRFVYGTNYLARCTCGDIYPSLFYKEAEHCAQTPRLVQCHRDYHHLKHLVTQLLDEDWINGEGVIAVDRL